MYIIRVVQETSLLTRRHAVPSNDANTDKKISLKFKPYQLILTCATGAPKVSHVKCIGKNWIFEICISLFRVAKKVLNPEE